MYRRYARLFITFSLIISTLIIISCDSKKQGMPAVQNRARGPLAVDGFVVRTSSVSEDVQVPGSLLPLEETQLRAEVGGRIVDMNISEGKVVEKGTVLVKLFDADLQAQLKKLKVQLQIAEKTEERNRELLKINGISQQEYDLSNLGVENLKADIQSTEIAISKTSLRAPYRGKLGLRNFSLGSYVSPADVITTIRQVEQLKLEFSVPEKYAKQIQPGHIVQFMIDGGEKDHQAVVMATENSVDQSTRTLKIRALVKEQSKELVPGVFAKINLQLGMSDKAMLVPTQAVIPTARNKQVILLRKDSALFTVVETGVRDSAYIQVVSGLQVGDTIITTGLMAIRPNAKVKISKVDSPGKTL